MLYRSASVDVLLKFRYEEHDFANALRLRIAGALRGPLERSLATVVLLVGCVVAYQLVARGAMRTFVAIMAVLVVLVLAAAVGAFVVLPRLVLQRRAELQGPMTVDVSDEGITVTAGEQYETIPWTEFVRVETDKRLWALYHGGDVLLVPRRVFRSGKQAKAFSDLVERFVRDDARGPQA
jgi:hypothetical protein